MMYESTAFSLSKKARKLSSTFDFNNPFSRGLHVHKLANESVKRSRSRQMTPRTDSREICSNESRYCFFWYQPLDVEYVSFERSFLHIGFLYHENDFAQGSLN